jgi:hypothetical protein
MDEERMGNGKNIGWSKMDRHKRATNWKWPNKSTDPVFIAAVLYAHARMGCCHERKSSEINWNEDGQSTMCNVAD